MEGEPLVARRGRAEEEEEEEGEEEKEAEEGDAVCRYEFTGMLFKVNRRKSAYGVAALKAFEKMVLSS
ncbi:Hypothetical predicted protein [Scomber scombrus]|uniref:Uncharacterized protein n=1 Tax=Scomber scombrus TaxID=13677 RepID=A0AAV1PJH6_SCOSC